jgi:hypothetical protein
MKKSVFMKITGDFDNSHSVVRFILYLFLL